MMRIALAYIVTVPIAVIVDLSWAGFFMRSFYASQLSAFLSLTVDFLPLVWFYLLLTLGIFYFAAYPGYRGRSFTKAMFSGAFLGVIAYGTYDLTNMATLPHWPLIVTVIDIAWGGVVCGATALAGFSLLKFLKA